MPGMVNLAFDSDEAVDIHPIGRNIPVISANSVFPRRSEGRALDSAQQIDPIRGDSQLENFFRIFRFQEMRTSEFGQGSIRPPHVLLARIDPDIHIFGIPGLRVINERQTADNQIPHLE
ncbi:MAG: hypothetical protein ACLFQQ_19930, partial [Desulfococcaceae bacterium]